MGSSYNHGTQSSARRLRAERAARGRKATLRAQTEEDKKRISEQQATMREEFYSRNPHLRS